MTQDENECELVLQREVPFARELVWKIGFHIGEELATAIIKADQSKEEGITAQRERVRILRDKLALLDTPESRELASIAACRSP